MEPIVIISIDDREWSFSKLERHVLYSAAEDKAPSYRLYSVSQVAEARHNLILRGLVNDDPSLPLLTPLGQDVVTALRARHT